MKVALVGLGYWGSKLLRNLVSLLGVDRVVAVDYDLDRLASTAATYPGLALAASLEDVLPDRDVRAVLVATPTETHAALARLSLEEDRHVFVEKPLAMSVEDAGDLVALADRRGLSLMVGHTFVFSPRVECIAQYLAAGSLGAVHYVTSSRLNLGLHRSDANVIWDLAPHDFSIVFHLLGEYPVTVQTVARSTVRPGLADIAFMNLTFPSGTIANVSVSWLAPRKVRSTVLVGEARMIVYDDTQADEPIRIYDKGVIVPEAADFGSHQLTYRYGDTIAPHVSAEEPLTRELRHFLACVRGEAACVSDGRFGLAVVEALSAADLSARLGGAPVQLSEAPLEVVA